MDTEAWNLRPEKYSKEEEFSKPLQKYLDGRKITARYHQTELTEINTKHDKQRKPDNLRPDIIVERPENTVETLYEWPSGKKRRFTNPFYIECKLTKKEIQNNLTQLLKYNYRQYSDKQSKLSKYGDFYVAITCPEFLSNQFDPDKGTGYLNNRQLVRTLWKLGFGILYKEGPNLIAKFNEQESVIFKDSEVLY